jgi:hypothetical protein
VTGHLLIVLGAPALLGDLLAHAFGGESDVRLIVDSRADPHLVLADHPTATVVVLDDRGDSGVVWRRDETPSTLAPLSLQAVLDAARRV